jgi:hypothetical protein
LFIGADNEEEKVRRVKEKYNIQGDVIVLNDNGFQLLQKVLGFSSYPTHFLLAPSGIVINNRVSFISGDAIHSPSVDKIKKQIRP